MRILVASLGRFIALFVTFAMLGSSIAMAGYVCPKAERQRATMIAMAAHEHAADMQDMHHGAPEQQAPCVQQHAGNKQALEHAPASPDPTLPAIVSMQLVLPVELPAWQTTVVPTALHDYVSQAPPFLRTRRLRI